MPLNEALPAFFTEEWERFVRGVGGLDPATMPILDAMQGRFGDQPGEPRTINIPGWNNVIRTGPRPVTTREQWREYYAAAREGRPPNLPPGIVSAITERIIYREAVRTSAQPQYMRAWGQIMTAIDNVQDLASTISTFGRLVLWGLTPVLNWLGPALSPAAAQALARAAADRAMAAILAELSAARLVAPEFARAIARAAYGEAFRRAILPLGARVAVRLIPIVGWAVLAADLLNLMNFLGILAIPAYALLCNGPRAALAAGIPGLLLKRVLKQQMWTMASLNPFSRQARLARLARSAGRLPGISNLIEVAQTTETFWGYGLSLGGLYGMIVETIFAGELNSRGIPTEVNADPLLASLGRGLPPRLAPSSLPPEVAARIEARRLREAAFRLPTEQRAAAEQAAADLIRRAQEAPTPQLISAWQAARAISAASMLQATEDDLPDWIHELTMAAILAAVPELAELSHGVDVAALVNEGLDHDFAPPGVPGSALRAEADEIPGFADSVRRWPLPGNPERVRGAELVTQLGQRIAGASARYFRARRNRQSAPFYGAALNQATENLWHWLEGDPNILRWELTTDQRVLLSMAETGTLLPWNADPGRAWAFFQSAQARLEETGRRQLEQEELIELAAAADVPYIRLLAPEAPWPAEWREFLEGTGASGDEAPLDLPPGSIEPPAFPASGL